MKRLLIAALAAISLTVPFVPGVVRDAEARPDCAAVDYNGDGVVDIFDIVRAGPMPGGDGRVKILQNNFGEAC